MEIRRRWLVDFGVNLLFGLLALNLILFVIKLLAGVYASDIEAVGVDCLVGNYFGFFILLNALLVALEVVYMLLLYVIGAVDWGHLRCSWSESILFVQQHLQFIHKLFLVLNPLLQQELMLALILQGMRLNLLILAGLYFFLNVQQMLYEHVDLH